MEKTPHSNSDAPPLANPMATASLVLAIASVVLFGLFVVAGERWMHDPHFSGEGWELRDLKTFFMLPLFWLASVPAIVLGHLALRKIGRIFSPVKGKSVAKAGLFTGYLMTFAVPVAASLVVPTFSRINERGPKTQAISNCRQIITTLRLYSADQTPNYPDADPSKPTNANDAFRLMFVGGEADNEMIFGCPFSPYRPDGNIGHPPDFSEAVKPGENHWAMTRGISDSASGTYPLIFENPIDASWPPKWNANAVEVPKPGRVWRGGKIIIGMNDSSVAIQSLESENGERVGLKPLDGSGKDLFTQNQTPSSILDVAR